MTFRYVLGVCVALGLVGLGCAKDAPQKDPSVTASAAKAPAPASTTLHLGAPIAAGSTTVALADIAKNPGAYKGKTVTTSGTVTSVCQHMGCWMEIKDDASQAHIKMAGHDFFVPKSASGKKARVQATLVGAPDEDEADCNQEEKNAQPSAAKSAGANQNAGHAVAKLQLEATGVELD